jgi:hypothetical protein
MEMRSRHLESGLYTEAGAKILKREKRYHDSSHTKVGVGDAGSDHATLS